MSGELAAKDGITPIADGEGPDKPTGKLARRALILGAATGVGAAAAVVAGASPAGATDGDVITVGGAFSGDTPSEIRTPTRTALRGICGGNGNFVGPYAGVYGESNSDLGVVGISNADDGVQGATSQAGASGVAGIDQSGGGVGVSARSNHGIGVYGESVGASGLIGSNTPGVLGDSSTNDGVAGFSSAASGVHGVTNKDGQSGVYGDDASADGGYGVHGFSNLGNGVYGINFGPSGIAPGPPGWSETRPPTTGLSVCHEATMACTGSRWPERDCQPRGQPGWSETRLPIPVSVGSRRGSVGVEGITTARGLTGAVQGYDQGPGAFGMMGLSTNGCGGMFENCSATASLAALVAISGGKESALQASTSPYAVSPTGVCRIGQCTSRGAGHWTRGRGESVRTNCWLRGCDRRARRRFLHAQRRGIAHGGCDLSRCACTRWTDGNQPRTGDTANKYGNDRCARRRPEHGDWQDHDLLHRPCPYGDKGRLVRFRLTEARRSLHGQDLGLPSVWASDVLPQLFTRPGSAGAHQVSAQTSNPGDAQPRERSARI